MKKTTEGRSNKKHGRVVVDLSGKKPALSMDEKQYGMIFRDDATRMSKEYFVKHKSDARSTRSNWLTPGTSALPKSSVLMTRLSWRAAGSPKAVGNITSSENSLPLVHRNSTE